MEKRLNTRILAVLLCVTLLAAALPVFASAASAPVTVEKKISGPKLKALAYRENGVRISWNSVKGAAKYRVYRKTKLSAKWTAIGTTSKKYYRDKKAQNNTVYYYSVRALNAAGKVISNYSPNTKKILYFKTPEMSSATAKSNGVMVKWNASAGAKAYRVERSANGGKWQVIGTSTAPEYLDKKVRYGTEYSYRVRVLAADKKTVQSSFDHTPVSVTFTKKASITSLKNRNGNILVKWGNVTGITNYRLYRKIGEGDWFTVVDNTTDTRYVDTDVLNNLTYTYYVRGITADGKEFVGDYDANGMSITFLVAPTLLNCVRSGGNLVTSWEAVEGAYNYNVYRRIGNGDWILVGSTTATSFADSTMPSGTWCEYTVSCADGAGNPASTYGTMVVGATSYLDRPVLTSAVNGEGFITITWKPVDKATNYVVFKKVGDEMPVWTRIGTTGGATSFVDNDVLHNKKYTYTVAVRSADDTEDESMYDENGLVITYYNPTRLKAVENVVSGVKLTWYKADGIPNYRIWRKTGNSDWVAIATVHGATVSYAYTDTDVVATGHYWYSVSSIASSEGAFSTPGLDITFYAAPYITSVENKDGSIKLEWDKVDGIGAYAVQRKIGTGDWATVVASTTDTSYTDADVTSGKKYTYRVGSIENGAVVSGWRVSTTRVYLSRPNLTAVTTPAKGQAKLTWNKVTGAESYDIYAQLYPGGDWSKVGTAEKNKTSITIQRLASERYQFKIVAVNGSSYSVDSNTRLCDIQ